VIATRPLLGAGRRNWCYAIDEGHWIVGGAVNNGGIALSWLQDVLNGAFRDIEKEERLSFEDILSLAAEVEPGAGGVVCLPLLAGERSPNWNMNARAALFGMTMTHDARHLARALLEGIGYRFRSLDEMLADVGLEIRQVRASGGFTRSPFWVQLMADVLGRELSVPECGESSALGAAFWAMGNDGPCREIERVGDWAPVGPTFTPNPDNVAVYSRLYPLFKELYQALAPLFESVAQFQAGGPSS
jgi:gluconokinase